MNKVIVCGVLLVSVFAATAWGAVGGGDITFPLSNASNGTFGHDAHVTKHKQKCGECHYRLYTTTAQRKDVTMAQMQKGQSCGACHNGQRAFDVKGSCNKCHP
jgi:c(7)-type cytochrome triheme protein